MPGSTLRETCFGLCQASPASSAPVVHSSGLGWNICGSVTCSTLPETLPGITGWKISLPETLPGITRHHRLEKLHVTDLQHLSWTLPGITRIVCTRSSFAWARLENLQVAAGADNAGDAWQSDLQISCLAEFRAKCCR